MKFVYDDVVKTKLERIVHEMDLVIGQEIVFYVLIGWAYLHFGALLILVDPVVLHVILFFLISTVTQMMTHPPTHLILLIVQSRLV